MGTGGKVLGVCGGKVWKLRRKVDIEWTREAWYMHIWGSWSWLKVKLTSMIVFPWSHSPAWAQMQRSEYTQDCGFTKQVQWSDTGARYWGKGKGKNTITDPGIYSSIRGKERHEVGERQWTDGGRWTVVPERLKNYWSHVTEKISWKRRTWWSENGILKIKVRRSWN